MLQHSKLDMNCFVQHKTIQKSHLVVSRERTGTNLNEQIKVYFTEAPGQSTSDPSCDKTSPDSCRHVMISYQWDVQDTMIVVKNKLQAAGFNVWMDLEQMGGSTLEAMAKAVEDSAVVLVCVSQKYKESPNCRSGDKLYTRGNVGGWYIALRRTVVGWSD